MEGAKALRAYKPKPLEARAEKQEGNKLKRQETRHRVPGCPGSTL